MVVMVNRYEEPVQLGQVRVTHEDFPQDRQVER